ncbi:MAG: hypothetical protein H6706_17190 [Myxococcales bacterium]|nr:hypothetical protein [Myxococcales bacterium]
MDPTTLVPCARCGVHVQAAQACPFCERRGHGRVLAASVLALGLAACSPPPAPVYGGPPEPLPAPESAPVSAAPESAAPESAAPESAAPATEAAAPATVDVEVSPAPAYGGPPPALPAPPPGDGG